MSETPVPMCRATSTWPWGIDTGPTGRFGVAGDKKYGWHFYNIQIYPMFTFKVFLFVRLDG